MLCELDTMSRVLTSSNLMRLTVVCGDEGENIRGGVEEGDILQI